jgi:hypothetical protein
MLKKIVEELIKLYKENKKKVGDINVKKKKNNMFCDRLTGINNDDIDKINDGVHGDVDGGNNNNNSSINQQFSCSEVNNDIESPELLEMLNLSLQHNLSINGEKEKELLLRKNYPHTVDYSPSTSYSPSSSFTFPSSSSSSFFPSIASFLSSPDCTSSSLLSFILSIVYSLQLRFTSCNKEYKYVYDEKNVLNNEYLKLMGMNSKMKRKFQCLCKV